MKPNKPWDPWPTAIWMCDNTEAQYMVITTTPPSIHDHFRLSTSACDFFKTLQDLFEKKSTAMTMVHKAWYNDTTCMAAQANNEVRNRSGRKQESLLGNGMRREHKCRTTNQEQVGRQR